MLKPAVLSLALLGFAAPALAESQLERDMRDMQEIARGAAERMIGAVGQMLEQLPTYEKPEVLDNGDIIIRRKPRDEPVPEDRAPPRREAPPPPPTDI